LLGLHSVSTTDMFGVGGVARDCLVYPVELTLWPDQ
jgi:hypothetical protein